MKLYLRDRFQWGEPLELRDGSGRTRYVLTGDAYAPVRRLHVADLAGREAVSVRQALPSLFPRFEIEVYGKPVGELVRDLSFLPPRCTVSPSGWEVEAGAEPGSFAVTLGDEPVAACRRDPEGLLLELPEGREALAALGVLLTVRCVFINQ